MKYVGTPYEHTAPPEFYQKYAGHDNNRDWFMFNLRETRNGARQLYAEWFPQIVYDQHQSGPFPARIFVPPFTDPLNPNIPPRVMRGVNLIGEAMARRLDREGKTGAISRIGYDTWWNGGMRTAPYFHNMIGLLTETSHASATPAVDDPQTFPRTFADGRPTLEPTIDYSHPYRGGEWHLRDTCDYMQTTSMAVLAIGARRRDEWLYGIYCMGRDAIEAGRDEVYVIPGHQWDPGTAVKLVNVLRRGGVEVERAARPFSVAGQMYPDNSFVIRGAQPFRPYITDLLNPQVYPDMRRSPNAEMAGPYDITGWTLPMQMGVKIDRHSGLVQAPADSLVPVKWAEAGDATITDSATFAFALDPRANNSFTAVNRLLATGETVYRTQDTVVVDEAPWPTGTFIVPVGPKTRARIETSTASLGLTVGAVDDHPHGKLGRLEQPRIGLYHGWGGNPDEGWTRWVLEQFEFPYLRVFDEDLRKNRLTTYDVVVLPDADYTRMVNGLSSTAAPPAYTGGMTSEGVSAVYNFVQQGGTLVTLDSAAARPIVEFGLAVRNIGNGRRAGDFSVPGALLEIELDPTHAVAYGMPSRAAAFVSSSPVFGLGASDRSAARPADGTDKELTVVARYPKVNLCCEAGGCVEKRSSPVELRWSKRRSVGAASSCLGSARSTAVSHTGHSNCSSTPSTWQRPKKSAWCTRCWNSCDTWSNRHVNGC